MPKRFAFFAGALLTAAALRAGVTISVAPRGSVPPALGVDLVLHRVDAPQSDVALKLDTAGAAATLPIDRGTWSVDASADGIWHPAQYFVAQASGTTVVVPVWRSGVLRGRVAIAGGGKAPGELSIRLTPVVDAADVPPTVEESCPIVDAAFRCAVPEGVFDVRLRAAAHIPRYFGSIPVAAAADRDLGTIALQRGTALVGRVVGGRGVKTPLERVVVTATAADATSRTALRTNANAKGFFELAGLPPGAYRVVARAAPRYASGSVDVVVVKDRTAELRDPLRLDEPQPIALQISPPLDPDGLRWHVTLTRAGATRTDEIIDDTHAAENGSWRSAPLHQATYTVSVGPNRGGRWLLRDLDLADAPAAFDVDLHAHETSGRVTLGTKPLAAKLAFVSGSTTAEATSDDEGRFTVLLPRESSEWRVDVRAERPPVRRRLRVVVPADGDLRLELPQTVVTGDVVTSSGKPPDAASVNISGENEPLVQIAAQRDGGFAVHGLAPGNYTAHATAFLQQSEGVRFTIASDGTSEPIHLVLRDEQKIRGRVVSDVAPVAGAFVTIVATDVRGAFGDNATTDAAGEFAATAPPGSREVDVRVSAPGFALKLLHTPLDRSGFVTLKLHQNGGSLEVPAAAGELSPYVERYGALELLDAFAFGWTATRSARGTVIVDNVEPGPYTVCMLRRSEYADFRAGAIDRGRRCATGMLAPFGTLALLPPTP